MFKSLLSIVLAFAFFLVPTSCEQLEKLGITEEEIIAGLKEALNFGATSAGSQLSARDGYLGNQLLRIGLPTDALSMIEKAYTLPGAETLIKPILATVVEKMNRGAEKAASKAAPIFANAITSMTLTDGRNILMGTDTAATQYLRQKTFAPLTTAFAPEINAAMEEVGAGSAWNSLFTEYNSYVNPITTATLGLQKINPNLGEYATGRALSGLFVKVAEEEKLIRDDPAKRTTDLLKKVFAEQDQK
jgi:hypothetical protein